MRRIIFLVNGHTEKDQTSGGDVRFREIVKRLDEFEKCIITTKYGRDIYKKENIKAKYVLVSEEDKTTNIIASYLSRMYKSFFLKMNISDESVIYSCSDFIPDVFPAFFWKFKNKNMKWVQIIHHLYGNPFRRIGTNYLVNLLGFLSQRFSFILIKNRADLIIVVNPLVKKQLLKIGFNGQKVMLNYNGVDLKKICNFKQSSEMYDCVFLGRLNASKGIFDLIEIWKFLIEKKSDATLAIIGLGDRQTTIKLKHRIKDNNLEKNIIVHGYLGNEKAFGILKSSRIFVFPSREEGFGISILEAMSCGLPVIAWDLAVYREIFEKGMIRVSIGKMEVFAKEIERLLNNKQLYENLSEQAAGVAQNYNWDKIADKEFELIKNI